MAIDVPETPEYGPPGSATGAWSGWGVLCTLTARDMRLTSSPPVPLPLVERPAPKRVAVPGVDGAVHLKLKETAPVELTALGRVWVTSPLKSFVPDSKAAQAPAEAETSSAP